MPITEAERSDLYTGLREVLGASRAETLMSAIPLYDLDEVATKRDLAVLRAELMAEFNKALSIGLGTARRETHTEFGTLRNELRTLRNEMHAEIGTLRTEMHSEIGTLRTEMQTEIGTLRTEMGTLRNEMHTEIGTLRNEMHTEIGTLRQSVEKRFDRLLYAMIAMPVAIIGAFVAIIRYLD